MVVMYGEKKFYRKALKDLGITKHPELLDSLKKHKDWELRNLYEAETIAREGSIDMAREAIKVQNLNAHGSIFGKAE